MESHCARKGKWLCVLENTDGLGPGTLIIEEETIWAALVLIQRSKDRFKATLYNDSGEMLEL